MYNRAFEDTDGQVCEAVWMDVEAAAATIGEQNYE
jgi:predicted lactoylglutathione lyase